MKHAGGAPKIFQKGQSTPGNLVEKTDPKDLPCLPGRPCIATTSGFETNGGKICPERGRGSWRQFRLTAGNFLFYFFYFWDRGHSNEDRNPGWRSYGDTNSRAGNEPETGWFPRFSWFQAIYNHFHAGATTGARARRHKMRVVREVEEINITGRVSGRGRFFKLEFHGWGGKRKQKKKKKKKKETGNTNAPKKPHTEKKKKKKQRKQKKKTKKKKRKIPPEDVAGGKKKKERNYEKSKEIGEQLL